MAYEDYIPKGATLGKPVYFTKQITTGANSKVERTFFKPLLMYTFDRTIIGNNESVTNLHRIAYDTAAPHLKVPYPFIREWTTGEVFHTGSYIDVGAAIRYRYIGIDPLHLDSAPDLVKYHPSKVGFNGVRVNAKLFMPYSASIETLLSNAAGETSIKTMNNKGLRFVEDCTTGEMLSFFGLRASHAIVYIMDTSHPGKNVYEKFTVDLTYKRKLAIVAPIPQCEIFVDFYPQGFSVECSAALKSKIVNIGEMRVGHTNKTESVYKDVLSDGMVKTQTTKTWDVFTGTTIVKSEDLQRVEYELSDATTTEHVLHVGAGEQFDQRMYLCRIEYDSPATEMYDFSISLSGHSIAQKQKETLVSYDSTNGIPL